MCIPASQTGFAEVRAPGAELLGICRIYPHSHLCTIALCVVRPGDLHKLCRLTPGHFIPRVQALNARVMRLSFGPNTLSPSGPNRRKHFPWACQLEHPCVGLFTTVQGSGRLPKATVTLELVPYGRLLATRPSCPAGHKRLGAHSRGTPYCTQWSTVGRLQT